MDARKIARARYLPRHQPQFRFPARRLSARMCLRMCFTLFHRFHFIGLGFKKTLLTAETTEARKEPTLYTLYSFALFAPLRLNQPLCR
jgi:hypothetical protein